MPKTYMGKTEAQKVADKRQNERNTLAEKVGEKLGSYLRRNRISQEEAAKKYGVSARTIGKIERGQQVQIQYHALLEILLDTKLTISEVEQ